MLGQTLSKNIKVSESVWWELFRNLKNNSGWKTWIIWLKMLEFRGGGEGLAAPSSRKPQLAPFRMHIQRLNEHSKMAQEKTARLSILSIFYLSKIVLGYASRDFNVLGQTLSRYIAVSESIWSELFRNHKKNSSCKSGSSG